MTDLFSAAQKQVSAPQPSGKPRHAPPAQMHICAVCGQRGAFGFGVSLRTNRTGKWACADHREQVRVLK